MATYVVNRPSPICKPKKNDDDTDMTYDDNGEPTIGLFWRDKYRFLAEDTKRYIGILIDEDTVNGRHKLLTTSGDFHYRIL